jgi:hypothetical protein
MQTIPFGVMSDCLRERTVIPFLGSAASYVGAAVNEAIPSAANLSAYFAKKAVYPGPVSDPLTKISQYLEEGPADRSFILSKVKELFNDNIHDNYECSFSKFLTEIPPEVIPPLIVSTNYDSVVECALQNLGIPYISITHILRGSKYAGRLLCYSSIKDPICEDNIMTKSEVDEFWMEKTETNPHIITIYKMHGSAKCCSFEQLDSIVLTENDYTDFMAQDLIRSIPTCIVDILRKNRLLFLGYSLSDWNFRVLLRKISNIQKNENISLKKHWAILLNTDDVETAFWDHRGVRVYCASLDEFLIDLRNNLKETFCESISRSSTV